MAKAFSSGFPTTFIKLPSTSTLDSLPAIWIPLPWVAIVLLKTVALPFIILTPTDSTPNPSQTVSLPTSEEVRTIRLSFKVKLVPLYARPVV